MSVNMNHTIHFRSQPAGS